MQFDSTANFSGNCAFETRRQVSLELNNEKCKLKAQIANKTSKLEKIADEVEGNEEKYEVEHDTDCESPDIDICKGIILNVDLYVSYFSMNIDCYSPFMIHVFLFFSDLRSV